MKIITKLLAALVLFIAPVIAFQTSDWGIDFITKNYWVRFIHPLIASFLFAGIVTGSFKDYLKPWKVNKELNPTRWIFVISVIITIILSLLIE